MSLLNLVDRKRGESCTEGFPWVYIRVAMGKWRLGDVWLIGVARDVLNGNLDLGRILGGVISCVLIRG